MSIRMAAGATAATLLLTGLGSAIATPALADPHPDHKPTYEATADLDGRLTPEPSKETFPSQFLVKNHVQKGQRIRITCQAPGELKYGSRVWDLVDGREGPRFVPDRFIKTGKDGFSPEIRRCKKKNGAYQ